MHNSHQGHVHQRAQFNKIMRDGSKEKLEQALRPFTLTASRWESPFGPQKKQVKATHFGWEKETPHAKTLSPQVIFHFLATTRLMAVC